MNAHFPPSLVHFAFAVICAALFLSASPVSAADYLGPVFPDEDAADSPLGEPSPLPKRNPLLQRPSGKQVVFDELDPITPAISQSVLQDDEYEVIQSVPVIRQRQTPLRKRQVIEQVIDADNVIFTNDGKFIQDGVWQSAADASQDGCGGCYTAPIPITFGMGLLDNFTLFADTTTFKTELNNGAGSFGLGEGLNWSTPITPQGTLTAQYGVRAVQGDMFSRTARSQCFMTAGVFKRFELISLQGGAAFDWLHDHSQFGSVDIRQMRCELSVRSFRSLEYGFMGGFDAFGKRPATPQIDALARVRYEQRYGTAAPLGYGGGVAVQDYYLLFLRKHLDSGGQVEFRWGMTERGDVMFSALGEAAISDRLAVNGGLTMLAPSEGHSLYGNQRESWSLSLGVILYFRGGAACRQSNLYRPMFDVAGNHSLFTRIVGR